MRWTYQLLVVIHLLLTAQTIAQPVASAVGRVDTFLSKREPLPSHRSKRLRSPTPSSSGSGRSSPLRPSRPKKQKKQKKQKAPPKDPDAVNNIKSKSLKCSGYRAKAIKKEPPGGSYKGTHEADHILEAQTVAHYLNQHRPKGQKIDENCKKVIKDHMNHEDNLKILKTADNQSKKLVVAALIKDPHPATKFSSTIKDHIKTHKSNILRTARKIDKEFSRKGACPQIRGPNGGIRRAAQEMISHALRP